MLLTPYGWREWSIILVVGVALGVGAFLLGWWWAVVVIGVVVFALLMFFRDPPRRIRADLPDGAMLSPADGTISAVLDVEHHDATDGPAKVVRIFLSVLNVHVNRAPYDGRVTAITHKPGQYLNAQTEESAAVNESNLVTMDIGGETIGVRQVAGLIARRIVCGLAVGDARRRGERYGMIKFGSTTELILPRPDDVTVHVKKGDKVRGGKTVLATLAPRGD